MTVRQEEREPALQFSLLRRMRYRTRLVVVGLFALAGLALQIAFLSFWAGFPCLLAAVICSWVAGFDNKLDKRSFHHDVAWETAPFDRLATIRKLDRAGRRWDTSALDVTNLLGGLIFGLLLVGALLLATAVSHYVSERAGIIVGGDAVLLLLSQWFSGMRARFRQADLMVKVDHVLEVMEPLRREVEGHGELRVQLLMRGKDDQRVPGDLKLSVQVPEAPAHFLGVQAQIVLNRVQGTPYPYFYAVVLAREGHGLFEDVAKVALPRKVILETQSQKDVDVAILRQRTTRTSGYHTRAPVSRRILRTALEIAAVHLARTAALDSS
ncbi:MAG: hypothetical protein ACYTEZ_03340 [Planctomycetota bacterium]